LLQERDPWHSLVKPNGKYFLTRNGSTLIAFAVGGQWKPGNPVGMVGAHTDSCALRIKPVSKKQADGFLQVGVETYGGGIWHTWFDRDLSLAGRVMVQEKNGAVKSRLIKIDKPILRIPTLAIHLERKEAFEFNKETQLYPIVGLVAAELNRQGTSGAPEEKDTAEETNTPYEPLAAPTERHHTYVVDLIAEAADCEPSAIVDFEILLYDTQKGCIGGMNDEFIFAARLDNLGMTYTAVEGLVASVKNNSLKSDPTIRLIALFDHEEIGSRTAQGADSNMLPAVLRRLSVVPEGSSTKNGSWENIGAADAHEQTLSRSFLISADMAHSVHPNYPAKYEASHRPEMNKGVVIKINANARYATNSPGIVLLQEAAKRAKPTASYACKPKADEKAKGGVPLQLFVVRNDSSCGSTIGPMLSAALGARTIDVGNPQLSMHSIRETGGTYDVEHAVNLFDSFFEHFGELEKKIFVD
jgi:aspartyl aminopeptidase